MIRLMNELVSPATSGVAIKRSLIEEPLFIFDELDLFSGEYRIELMNICTSSNGTYTGRTYDVGIL